MINLQLTRVDAGLVVPAIRTRVVRSSRAVGSLRWALLTFSGIVAVFAVFSAFHWDWTLDDAYISYRFADNLSDGMGFRWNAADPRPVEGFTTFLWVVLLAGLHYAGLETLTVAKSLGVVSGLGVLAILFWHGRPRTSPLVAIFAAGALAAHPYLIAHAVAGMETSLYMLLVTGQAVLAILASANKRYEAYYLASIVATFLVRPESAVFSGLLLVGYTLLTWDRRSRLIRDIGLYVVIPIAVYWAVRSVYFGHFVPTPFVFKQVPSLTGWLTSGGLAYVLQFFSVSILGGAVFVISLWMLNVRSRPIYPVILVAVVAQLLYFTTIRPTVGVADRFLIPFLPAFILVVSEHLRIVLSGGALFGQQRSEGRRRAQKWVATGGMLLVLVFSVDAAHRYRQLIGLEDYFAVRQANPAIAETLRSIAVDPQDVVMATGEAGALPYITGFRHVDMLGLTTESIAYEGFTTDAVYAANPDIIVTHSIKFSEVNGRYIPDAQEVARYVNPNPLPLKAYQLGTGLVSYLVMLDDRFAPYRLVRSIEVTGSSDVVSYYVFARRDSPYYPSVVDGMEGLDFAAQLQDYRDKHSVQGFLDFLRFWQFSEEP